MDTPRHAQDFLDAIPYSADPFSRCPHQVLADRTANCFDGAMLAAAALAHHGLEPALLDMRAVRDDDHVLCVFRRHGGYGAVAKSNFVGLRFREPVFRTVRELVMSYFEDYYNSDGEKTLRSYSAPLRLSRFDRLAWTHNAQAPDHIAHALDAMRHLRVMPRRAEEELSPVDPRARKAGMVGTVKAGLYRPPA
jgi:hypothetical protein